MSAAARVETLHFVPIPETIADEARRTMTDGFGHRLHVTTAQGPCRVCLRVPEVPEDLILLSYRPLPDTGPYAEVGPIFIHAARCAPYASLETFPPDFAQRHLILRAYGRYGEIVDAVIAGPGEAQRTAEAFLSDESIAEVHARHVSYTCFDFKIVRAP